MIDAISNPFIQAVNATGKIKKYQIVVGTVLLMIVPVSYVTLKLGGSPQSVFYVHILLAMVAFCCRLYLVRQYMDIPIFHFIKSVLSRMLLVAVFSSLTLSILRLLVEESLTRLIISCIVSTLSVLLAIYIIGLTAQEKIIAKRKVIDIINKYRNGADNR